MGKHFNKDKFTEHDFRLFKQKIKTQLYQLRQKIESHNLSSGGTSFGAELEMYLIDEKCQPKNINLEVLKTLDKKIFTEELNQYNLEINLPPLDCSSQVLSELEKSLTEHWNTVKDVAQKHGASVAAIGILPTLTDNFLSRDCMTDLPRYRALTNQLSSNNALPFLVDINAKESLQFTSDEVTLEGANTSFQVHYKVPPDSFADFYNAAQFTTPLVLATATNSPLLLGKSLWHETRIALFKQSIDNRVNAYKNWRQPSRVNFGQGWVRHSAWELFAESVSLYPPLLPYVSEQDEDYSELLLHHGTVWTWNRAVFDPGHNGHLRIEFRSLPAGPTAKDMIANAALAIGLTKGLASTINEYLVKLPFQYAEYNFYRAAKHGCNARILWPSLSQHELKEFPITEVLRQLLPKALEGLVSLGVDESEARYYLDIIEARLDKKQTGATWQLARLKHYEDKGQTRENAIREMFEDYLHNMNQNIPVSEW